jgi:hypothetical protein
MRSTITPAKGDSTRIGPNWQAASTPTATPLPVRWSTRRVSPTSVNQLPVFEIVCPMKNRRKLRERNDDSVRWTKLSGLVLAVAWSVVSSVLAIRAAARGAR